MKPHIKKLYDEAYNKGYENGFADGANSVAGDIIERLEDEDLEEMDFHTLQKVIKIIEEEF